MPVEAERHLARRRFLEDLGGEVRMGGRRERDPVAGPQAPRTFGEDAPDALPQVAMERQLDPRLAAPAGKARRDDAGVVEDHDVAPAQEARQVGDAVIGEALPADDQEPGGVARRRGALGDQRARQVEIEIGNAHAGGRGELFARTNSGS